NQQHTDKRQPPSRSLADAAGVITAPKPPSSARRQQPNQQHTDKRQPPSRSLADAAGVITAPKPPSSARR
ncbi:hypothetical protein CKJ90_32925, partial [Klebsiella pneumoniae]